MRVPISVLAFFLLSNAALATERPANLEAVPDIPPPPGMVDAGLEPQVTILQRGEDRVEEYRIGGRLYMVKVTPPHGRPYFLVDERGDGIFNRHDVLGPPLVVPMWVIKEF